MLAALKNISAIEAFNLLPSHIYWKDKNNCYLGCNAQLAQELGFTQTGDIVGKTDYDLFTKKEADQFSANDLRIMNSGIPETIEESNFLSIKMPLWQDSDTVIGLIGVSIDIKQHQKKLTTNINLLEEIVAAMPGHIYWKDRNGVVLGCNEQQAMDVGLKSRHEAVGKRVYDFINKNLPAELKKQYISEVEKVDKEIMESGATRIFEELDLRLDGTEATFLSEKKPLYDNDGQIIGILGISVDITERKQLEDQLRQAKIVAEAANKLKSEFIRNMQHDIRTPISGIWSVLSGYLQRPDPQGLQEVLPLVVKATEQLLNICNEVIDFENVAYGDEQIVSKPLSLIDLVNGVVELNSAAVVARQLYLKLDVADNVPTWIESDEHRLKKIIINLIGNAIKFTQTGGVTLSVLATKKTKTKCSLQFIVQDTGIGIPEGKTDRIFEKFSRLNPSDTQLYKGTGLGLFIVKKFVEELDGKIVVESVEGEGARFIVSIDVAVATEEGASTTTRRQHTVGVEVEPNKRKKGPTRVEAAPTTEQVQSTKHSQPKVLMIEDDPLALFAAEHIWKQLAMKVSVDTATNLIEARQLLKNKTYDLVLSDLGLPDGNADILAQEVRQDKSHPNYNTPMVALTAHNDIRRHKAALEAGFNTVLCKPLMVARAQHLLDVYVTERGKVMDDQVEPGMDMNNVIDWDLCLNMANGSESLARELLTALVATFPAEKKTLTKAFEDNDQDAIRAILHRFRGGLSYLGVPRLAEAIEVLQLQVRASDNLVNAKMQLRQFFDEMDALSKLCQRLTEEGAGKLSTSVK